MDDDSLSAVRYHDLSMVVYEKAGAETEVNCIDQLETDFTFFKSGLAHTSGATEGYFHMARWVSPEGTYSSLANEALEALGGEGS